MLRTSAPLLLLLPLLVGALHARQTAPTPRSRLEVGRAGSAIRIDGRLDEPAWQTATVIPLTYETDPGDNTPARVRTECRITYDTRALYFGCRAWDTAPGAIRAYLTDRDQVDTQDRIGLMLDPFRDSRRGFAFAVTASGVQNDFTYSAQDGASDAWDAIWDAEGRRTEDGYVIEAAVPVRSLRFPVGVGSDVWNFYFWRRQPRDVDREYRSVRLDRGNQCLLCQLATLEGLSGLRPGLNLEVTPTFTTARTDRRPTLTAPALERGEVDPESGLDLRWSPQPSVTLNATINPDFNQVESDEGRLQSNEQFALFFPERRPFFLEGSELFQTPMRTFYSRSLADPAWGTKVSGKSGGWAFGALAARDIRTNLLFPGPLGSTSTSLEASATTLVGRVRRDVGSAHTLGALVIARQGKDGYSNGLAGVDARFQIAPPLTLNAQVARSRTTYPAAVVQGSDQPTGSFEGTAVWTRMEYGTRNWFGQATLKAADRGFRADAGFIPEGDWVSFDWRVRRLWWPEHGAFQRLSAMGGSGFANDGAGAPLFRFVFAEFAFDGGWQSSLAINPDYFHRFLEGRRFGLARVNVYGETRPVGDLLLSFFGQIGAVLDYANARKAAMVRVQPRLSFRVGTHVDLQLLYDARRLRSGGSTFSNERLTRIRAVYNFDRRWFLRGIVQYQELTRDPDRYRVPVTAREAALATQLLLSYKLNPQSVAFLGYSDLATDDDLTPAATANGLRRMERTFFLKLSYTWRP